MSEVATPGVAVGTHEVIWVEGVDAISFLDSQISQDVAGMVPGAVARSFLLEPRGKLRAILWVLRADDRVGLVTPAGTGEAVIADLVRFRFRVDVTFRHDARPVASVWGLASDAPGWQDHEGTLTIHLPGTAPSTIVAGDGSMAPTLEPDEVSLHRVLAAEPIFGVDVDESTIPQETGLVGEAVSFTKGCYLGQELVARIDSRGHVNKTLRQIAFPESGPGPGDEVTRDGTAVGVLGTVAPVAQGVLALAMLRREVAAGDRVMAAGVSGTVAQPHGSLG